MPFFKQFQLTLVEPPVASRGAANPTITRRNKLIDGIKEQITIVSTEIKGDKYVPPTNKKGNPKRVRIWYWHNADKTVSSELRYGPRRITEGKNNAFIVPNLKALVAAYEAAIVAVNAGEFDKHLEAVAARPQAKKSTKK